MSSLRWRLLAVPILLVVAVASVASFAVWNRSSEENTNSLSLMSGVQTSVSATSIQATSTTSVSSPPIQWITLGKVRSVDYYETLLESNGTQPYLALGEELRLIPNITNASAVGKITFLALNATNAEVKQAFQLMMSGGTPDPSDFGYPVPNYNTELQVLYWLACQNEFKRDDTLVLAMAMVNGLWVAMGNEQVKDAVKAEASALLSFFRETNELQQQQRFYQLESYPLEAKIVLAWTGGMTVAGPNDEPFRLEDFRGSGIDLKAYNWNTVSVDTLRKMRTLVYDNWINQDVTLTFSRMEEYFYFSGFKQHMDYQAVKRNIVVDNETVLNQHINNVDWEYRHFEETGRILGVCNEEATFVAALTQSVGIASTEVNVNWKTNGHTFPIFFNPAGRVWMMYEKQMLNLNISDDEPIYALVFRPPVYEGFKYKPFATFDGRNLVVGYPFYLILGSRKDVGSLFVSGLSTAIFKSWILTLQ